MTDPEYATLRDLVRTVKDVDDKLDTHKLDVERRFGRLEKVVGLLAFLVLIPKIGGPSASEVVTHVAAIATHII
jgi:hypothetical protein